LSNQFFVDSVVEGLPTEKMREKCYDSGGIGGIYGSTTPCFDSEAPPCPYARECFLEKREIRKSKAEDGEKMDDGEFEKWLGDYQRKIEKMTVKREGKQEAEVLAEALGKHSEALHDLAEALRYHSEAMVEASYEWGENDDC